MKYTLGLLIILLVYGCGATLQYYRFQVRTFPYPKNITNTSMPDSMLVLKALTWADTSDLLEQDWNQLKNFAKERQLILKTEKKKILVEKYKKLSVNTGDVDTETKTNARDLKEMKLIGTGPNKVISWLFIFIFGFGIVILLGYLAMNALINDTEEAFCYIATVCYNDPYASEVMDLKRFRDHVMRKFYFSMMLVKIYYIISPSIARYLKGKDSINYCIRTFVLNPIVFVARRCIKPS